MDTTLAAAARTVTYPANDRIHEDVKLIHAMEWRGDDVCQGHDETH